MPKVFPKEEYVNLAGSITLLWCGGSIFSPLRYPYLSALPDESFSSFTLSSIVITTFYIMPERFVLKGKGLSDAIVVSINKK